MLNKTKYWTTMFILAVVLIISHAHVMVARKGLALKIDGVSAVCNARHTDNHDPAGRRHLSIDHLTTSQITIKSKHGPEYAKLIPTRFEVGIMGPGKAAAVLIGTPDGNGYVWVCNDNGDIAVDLDAGQHNGLVEVTAYEPHRSRRFTPFE